ncbi:hypothetical protein AXG93_3102s1540 [Marchantia polymorpha subsp. ruderalis]|uniref:Thaumatin-like protein n=2 Tax=Marchantia polymorpha TaxID=3197 RepID=A0A176W8D1_MARPO|nr:hypothetical protein AXG93_3102s1540 [Marchantia polymorpha subsp. ruderalis]
MATSRLSLGLFLLYSISTGIATGCVVKIRNRCPFSVTACSQTQQQDIVQYDLRAGASQTVDLGATCIWTAAVVYASVTGKCAVTGIPNAATDRNLANLAEFTIGSNGLDFYDLSNVNAYTIGMTISPSSESCKSVGCTIDDISSFCQPNNVLLTHLSGSQSCINTDGTAGIGPTDSTKLWKSACYDAYSYNFDDATSTFVCPTGTDYEVAFCP